MGKSWREAVVDALLRQAESNGSQIVTNEDLRQHQLAQIEAETGARGKTNHQTMNRVLQELGRDKIIEFVPNRRGVYRLLP